VIDAGGAKVALFAGLVIETLGGAFTRTGTAALGAPLFERQWRSVVPTCQGDQLYSKAKPLIAALDQVVRAFKEPQAPGR
jgi:hypothetical protein